MAVSFPISAAMAHAISFIKGPSTYASSEEVRFANTVDSIIADYYPWHWQITAGVDIAISSGTQDYSMNASDQNGVSSLYQANLLDSGTEQPELWDVSDLGLPVTDTSGQPYAVALISPTQIRLYPNPDATYTFQWRYYAAPTVHTANTEAFDAPDAFNEAVKAGMIWQVLSYADDDRDEAWKTNFFALLEERKRKELVFAGRRRR